MTSPQGRQAVIVIHGIGEQSPMDTLRGFVEGLDLGDWYSKPDRLSDSDELRRLTLPPKHGRRPATDFYELYWAHHMAEGRPREVLLWASRLLLRRSAWRGTPLARTLNVLTALLCVSGLALLLVLVVPDLRQSVFASAHALPFWAPIVGSVVAGAASVYLARYVADAARYLTPRPPNIAARAAIRRQGVELLRSLHESGQYKRVVVVGHSLGSVIGYDILRHYWDEARWPDVHRAGAQGEVRAFEEASVNLSSSPTLTELDRFQQAQHRLWREQRERGVRWLVTDFITLGSPLANAPMLLGGRRARVDRLIRDRELPACPPIGDSHQTTPGFYATTLRSEPNAAGAELVRSFLIGDAGAVFAGTRWTNLYFPIRWGILGDLVGGPVAGVFGHGVWDIPVRRTRSTGWRGIFQDVFPMPHLSYWSPSAASSTSKADRRAENRRLGTKENLPTLTHHLGLEIERAARPYPPPDAADRTAS